MSGGTFNFSVAGSPGPNYTIQVSTNLATANWVNLFSLTLTNNFVPVTDMNATNGARFYRVQKN